jgi:hypothetical protein
MSNEPTTYHLLVTLHEAYGEEADQIAADLEDLLRRGVGVSSSVTHLTPQTLPERYTERLSYADQLFLHSLLMAYAHDNPDEAVTCDRIAETLT